MSDTHDLATAARVLVQKDRRIAELEAELARRIVDLESVRAARTQALAAEVAERAKRVAVESQLGAAHEEIARLEAALRQAARMFTIKGARKIVEQAIGKE